MNMQIERPPDPTTEETEEAIKTIDRIAKRKGIMEEPDFAKRQRILESITYGMVVHGDYHPLHVKAFMVIWRLRNNIDLK